MNTGRRLLLLGPLLLPLAAQAEDPDAAAPIQALNQGLLAGMRAGKRTPFMQRYSTLAPLVERAFDIPGVLQASVGPRLGGLPADQQGRLLDLFRKFTIASFVANFDDYAGERIEVLAEQRSVGADAVVATQIIPARGEPTRIDYVMHRTASEWRAIDVLLNGSISQNAVKRSDFRALIGSGDAARLIESLQRKVADLSGGALS